MATAVRNLSFDSVVQLPPSLGSRMLAPRAQRVFGMAPTVLVDRLGGVRPRGLRLVEVDDALIDAALPESDVAASVLDKDLDTPPGAPAIGARYIVNADGGPAAVGAWTARDNQLAEWSGTAWVFVAPTEGMQVWVEDEDRPYSWRVPGNVWVAGIPPAAHAASHLPSGADPITTAAPVAVSVGAAAAVGTAESIARSDHVHPVAAPGAPVPIGDAASTGGSTAPARADHVHVGKVVQKGSVTTLDGSATTALTFNLADNTVYQFRATITARRTNGAGRGTFVREYCAFREGGGGATEFGDTYLPIPDRKSDAGWNVATVVSGNDVLVRVTGAGGQSIDWSIDLEIVRAA